MKHGSSVVISGTECKKVTYKTSIFELFYKLKEKIYEILAINKYAYVENEKIYKLVDYGGSHSWIEKVLLKESPTKEEIEVLNALNIIEQILKEHCENEVM